MPHVAHYYNHNRHTLFDFIDEQYRDTVKVALLASVGFAALFLFIMLGQSM